MVKRKSLDENEPECGKGIPFPIQTFLWRQTRLVCVSVEIDNRCLSLPKINRIKDLTAVGIKVAVCHMNMKIVTRFFFYSNRRQNRCLAYSFNSTCEWVSVSVSVSFHWLE